MYTYNYRNKGKSNWMDTFLQLACISQAAMGSHATDSNLSIIIHTYVCSNRCIYWSARVCVCMCSPSPWDYVLSLQQTCLCFCFGLYWKRNELVYTYCNMLHNELPHSKKSEQKNASTKRADGRIAWKAFLSLQLNDNTWKSSYNNSSGIQA